MKNKLLALALASGCLLPAQAIEPGKSQSLTSPDQVPEGLSAADWSSIRRAYSASHTTKAVGVISQQAYVKPSNTGANDQFGRSVAVSGDTVVVGAYLEDSLITGVNSIPNEAAVDSGAAYVFVRSNGTWNQQAYLKASNTGAGDRFGYSVAVSGDTVVVGANREDSSTTGVNSVSNETAVSSGAAYVFVRSGGTWTQQAYVKASNTDASDNFGYSVAVSGEKIVVGAYGEDSSTIGVNSVWNETATVSGAAYVFTRSGGSWSQQAYLKASNTGQDDQFGYAVAVSGETVVVGARYEDSSTSGVNGVSNEAAADSGAGYVFVRSGVIWSQQAYLKASNTGADDLFGTSVAISGETVVIGSYGEASNGVGVNGSGQANNTFTASGAAYVFTRSGVAWSQQAYLKASNSGASDVFGYSVAVSGETVVIGAVGESSNAVGVNGIGQADNSAIFSGAAYVFTRSGGLWSQQAYLKASNTGADDDFGIFVAVSSGTIISGASREDSATSGINTVPNDAGTADNSGAAYIYTLPVAEPPAVAKYLIKVKVKKAKFGKVTGIGSFATGSTVKLKAKAKKGRAFVGWFEKKKLITKKKVLVIKNLTANRSLVAKFK